MKQIPFRKNNLTVTLNVKKCFISQSFQICNDLALFLTNLKLLLHYTVKKNLKCSYKINNFSQIFYNFTLQEIKLNIFKLFQY